MKDFIKNTFVWVIALFIVAQCIVLSGHQAEYVWLFRQVGKRIDARTPGEILGAIAWPVLVVWLGYMFRAEIKELIPRLKSIAGAEFVDNLPKSPAGSAPSQQAQTQLAASQYNTQKIAHIFWASGDMHSLIWHLVSGSPKDKIDFYFRQSTWHLRQCLGSGHQLTNEMRVIYNKGKALVTSDWTQTLRRSYASDVNSLMRRCALAAEVQQGDFVGEATEEP